jgi:hypothetical protein
MIQESRILRYTENVLIQKEIFIDKVFPIIV